VEKEEGCDAERGGGVDWDEANRVRRGSNDIRNGGHSKMLFRRGLFWGQMALASLVALSRAQKSFDFQGPLFSTSLVMDVARLKTAPYKQQVH
jgi:hypothetical protein